MNKNGQRIIGMFQVIASVFLVYLLYRELIFPLEEPEYYSELMMLGMLAGYLVLLTLGMMAVRKMPDKALRLTVVGLLAIAFVIQLCIAYGMQLQPIYSSVDLIEILSQDRSMVENGEHIFSNRSYFEFNTNNIGLAIIVYWVFWLAHALGCSNYELVGGVFNVMMNMMTYICAYRIARRFYDRRVSALFLFYLVSNPVLYAYASYYYTDTVSMGMTTLALDLFTSALKDRKNRWMQGTLLCGSGFVLLFAYQVRVTSLMVLLAAMVYVVLRGDYHRHMRQVLRVAFPFIGGVLVAMTCYRGLYRYHIDFDTTDTSVPIWHFVAMAANSSTGGVFDGVDVDETMAQPDHESKVTYNLQKWKNRVRENGLSGNIRLVLDKEARVWSRGDKGYFQYTQNVKEYTPIYEWITGRYSEYFRNYMLATNAAVLLLMLLSVAGSLVTHRQSGWQSTLLICWLGAVLFYVFWESHPRQSLSYLVIMSMMALPVFHRTASSS